MLQAVSLRRTNDLAKKEENAKSRRGQDGDPRHGVPGVPLQKPSVLFHSCVGNSFPNRQQLSEVARDFKGLAQNGGREDFSNNLCASLFIKAFLNESNFVRVHQTGQYL